VPPGLGGRIVLPFSLWLMKHTMLGNPLIHPWKELADFTEHMDMTEYMFRSYYICRGMKPVASTQSAAMNAASIDDTEIDPDLRVAAE
jgi:hypothetical protein